MLTVDQLAAVMPDCPRDILALWQPHLNNVMWRYDIKSKARIAAFMANVAHESDQLRSLEENLNYSVAALLRVFPTHFDGPAAVEYAHQPERIANRAYANRGGNGDEASGDGWRMRGRGIFQISLLNNYRAGSAAICGDAELLVKNPELAALPDYACPLAGWYWTSRGLNEYADHGNFDAVCDVINIGHVTPKQGDAIGYQQRAAYLYRLDEVLA